jgi:hypothetical protein
MANSTLALTLSIDAQKKYKFTKSNGAHMHSRGHIWLLEEDSPVDISITLNKATYKQGYEFAHGADADGSLAIFIGTTANTKNNFPTTAGSQFSNPLLSKSAQSPNAYNILTFTSDNSDGIPYFYQLNFTPVSGLLRSIDPIIVNKSAELF